MSAEVIEVLREHWESNSVLRRKLTQAQAENADLQAKLEACQKGLRDALNWYGSFIPEHHYEDLDALAAPPEYLRCDTCGSVIADDEGEIYQNSSGIALIACNKCKNKKNRATTIAEYDSAS